MTSGGDSPGMNAAIRAVVRAGLAEDFSVFGFLEGFRGLHGGDYERLESASVSEIIDRGGTILRTSRFEDFHLEAVQDRAAANLRALDVKALIVIGGNGSMAGAHALDARGIATIGVPASIDNDIGGTDLAIGHDTALNTVVDVLGKLRDTASSHERIFVVEVMGRKCGAIALSAGLAGGADHVCLPELPVADERQIKQVCELIERRAQQGKTHTLIIVSEGSGSAAELADDIRGRTGRDVRVSVPGHIQRGGSPSALDRILASRLGAFAARLAETEHHDVMAGFVKGELKMTPLDQTYAEPIQLDADIEELARTLS